MDASQLYRENMQAALAVIQTELEAVEIFSRVAQQAAAVGDVDRAARNCTIAASAVDGARRIAKSRVDLLYRLAEHCVSAGDTAGAASLTEQAIFLEEQLHGLIEAATCAAESPPV